jgi:acetyl-CoA C-acetyltransferase
MSREVVVLSAVRSAIGTFGGSLANMEPHELAGTVMKESIARSGVDPQQITYVTVGNCIPTDSRFAYVARVASIQAGCRWIRWPWPSTVCAHRACRAS